MNKRINLAGAFFICIIILTFTGCVGKEKKQYIKKYYTSGKLKSYGFYINDTIPVDTIVTLFENAKVLSKEVYDGMGRAVMAISYYENGIVKKKIKYKKGLAFGFTYDFFENGTVKQKSHFVNDLQIGDTYRSNQTNSIVVGYNFYEWHGRNINLLTYDSTMGKIIKDMRQTIYLDSLKLTYDSTINNYEILLVISNPPHCRSIVRIDYLSKDEKVIKSETITGLPFYSIKKQFTENLNSIKFSAKQYDSLTETSFEQWNTRLVNKK